MPKNAISRLVLLHETNGQDAVIPFASIHKIEPHNALNSRVIYTRGTDEHVMYVEGTVKQLQRWINDQLFPAA